KQTPPLRNPPKIKMVFFDGNVNINGTAIGNVSIHGSTISTSDLDMGNKRITSVGDPANPSDAATKLYVDQQLTANSQSFRIPLSRTTKTQVADIDRGAFLVTIMGEVPGSPVGVFHVAKASPVSHLHVVRCATSPGSGGTYIDLMWPPNSPLFISKTAEDFDGFYQVRIT
ncbi:hypothetical protein HK102_012613, partial [Quaeritorhiza haematococci]